MQTTFKLEVKDFTPALVKSVKLLTKKQVLVGVPAEKAGRRGKKQKMNNAALALIHDQGSPAQNIPARPFMEPGIKDVRLELARRLEQTGKIALRGGQEQDIVRALNAVGLTAQKGIKNRINSGPFEPLKPGTLAARQRRGRTGTKPLIDTGQLRNSISYVIEEAKK